MTVQAEWNGVVLAKSDDTVVVEGNHYFPEESIIWIHLRPSSTHTFCSWKGEASYYDVIADGKTNSDAAWFYPEPYDAARQIKGRVAFWHAVTVSES